MNIQERLFERMDMIPHGTAREVVLGELRAFLRDMGEWSYYAANNLEVETLLAECISRRESQIWHLDPMVVVIPTLEDDVPTLGLLCGWCSYFSYTLGCKGCRVLRRSLGEILATSVYGSWQRSLREDSSLLVYFADWVEELGDEFAQAAGVLREIGKRPFSSWVSWGWPTTARINR